MGNEEKILAMLEQMNSRFDKLEARLDRIEAKQTEHIQLSKQTVNMLVRVEERVTTFEMSALRDS